MKLFWLLLLGVPSVLISINSGHEIEDTPAILRDAEDPLYKNLIITMGSISSEVDQRIEEFTSITQLQNKRIAKLNKLVAESEITIQRLSITACASTLIATGFIVRELCTRNPEVIERIHSFIQKT